MTRLAERLEDLARRVDRNLPRRDDPEAFFVEKDQIRHLLEKLSKELAREATKL